MASIISTAAQAAHSVATSILARAPIQVGQNVPAAEVKEDSPDKTEKLVLKGKNVLIGVPGAFTTPCNAHLPGYIENFEKFKEKGVNGIYVFGVNDAFVMKAWKDKLAPDGTPIHFIADDKGAFVSSIGLIFDASPLLGGPRSKRFAIVTQDDKIVSVAVEEQPPSVTVTGAEAVLGSL